MKLPNEATVAVVDGKKLKLFRNESQDDTPKLIALPEQAIDHGNHGSGAGHHSSSANPDHGQLEEDGHSAGVAAVLNKAATAGEIQKLVVIASPRALGELRKHYAKQLSAVLAKEIDKDLTGHSLHDIEKAITAA